MHHADRDAALPGIDRTHLLIDEVACNRALQIHLQFLVRNVGGRAAFARRRRNVLRVNGAHRHDQRAGNQQRLEHEVPFGPQSKPIRPQVLKPPSPQNTLRLARRIARDQSERCAGR